MSNRDLSDTRQRAERRHSLYERTAAFTGDGLDEETGGSVNRRQSLFGRRSSIASTFGFGSMPSLTRVTERRNSFITGKSKSIILSIGSRESRRSYKTNVSRKLSDVVFQAAEAATGAEAYGQPQKPQREVTKHVKIPDFVPIAGLRVASELPKEKETHYEVGCAIFFIVFCCIVIPLTLCITLLILAITFRK